jgi:peroxin-3
LLPTAAENIIDGLPVEELTHELQKKRAERLARLNTDLQESEPSSTAPSILDDDGQSLSSFQADGYIQTGPAGESVIDADRQRSKRSKAQLWNDVKISCAAR